MLSLLFAVQEVLNPPVADAPAEERVVRGRLLNALDGTPVGGAACELWSEDFDEPMELVGTVRSALDGSFALEDPRRCGEKMRVRAEGYRSTVFAGEDEVFLFPRGEPFVLRALDLDGRPIAGARVRSHQTCQHAPPAVEGTTDAEGRVVFADAPPFEDGPEYEVRASGYGALTQLDWSSFGVDPVVYLPRRAEVRLHLLDADGAPLARRRFRQQGPGQIAFVTDDDGRALLDSLYESREIGLEESVKEGALSLFGWPPLEGECTLQIGRPAPIRELPASSPVLQVLAEQWSTLHVQFGADSTTTKLDDDTFVQRVPSGITLVVVAQGDEVHRALLEPLWGSRTIDLTGADTRIGGERRALDEVGLRFVVHSDDGAELQCSARLRWPGPQREDEDPSPACVLFHVPRGELFEVCFHADGHVPRFLQGRADAENPVPEPILLRRYAHLEFRGPVERIEVAGQVRTKADGEGWNVLELAPGFAEGQVWFSGGYGGSPFAMARTLAPGETTVLEEPSRRVSPR
ncbi:MAG: carboxypeptidase regulatory-like domain-containing protein [Planctomycetes bacterium]|nr:carboxypeptidase regulatory-like domain-containing protein [Planctomycetota bacterium]